MASACHQEGGKTETKKRGGKNAIPGEKGHRGPASFTRLHPYISAYLAQLLRRFLGVGSGRLFDLVLFRQSLFKSNSQVFESPLRCGFCLLGGYPVNVWAVAVAMS